jgi:hypothetical protein
MLGGLMAGGESRGGVQDVLGGLLGMGGGQRNPLDDILGKLGR